MASVVGPPIQSENGLNVTSSVAQDDGGRSYVSDQPSALIAGRRGGTPPPSIPTICVESSPLRSDSRSSVVRLGTTTAIAMHDFATVDMFQKRSDFGSRGSGLRHHLGRAWDGVQGWLAVIVVGVFSAFIAGSVDITVDWVSDLKTGVCAERLWFPKEVCCRHFSSGTADCTAWRSWPTLLNIPGDSVAFLAYVVMALLLATTAAWLVTTFSLYAAGSGIPEIKTILGGVHIMQFLGGWTLITKSVGLVLSVGSGLSLGKEGPYVHVASCVGNITSRLFHKYRTHESKKRELLSASAAVGVALAFGAPIGGVLFSLEEASYFFPHKVLWRSFFAAVVAALTLQKMDPYGTGQLVMFQVEYKHMWKWFDFGPFLVLGIVGGVAGGLFVKSNLRWCRHRKESSLREHPIAEVAVVVVITSVLQFWNPFMRHSMTKALSQMFQGCLVGADSDPICSPTTRVILELLWAAVLKLILTIFTFGLKVPAGIFIPSLFTGAAIGRVVGILTQLAYQSYPQSRFFEECHAATTCVVPGVYAIVGAAGMLAGVTRMTVSLVVIMFELTGGLEYVLPIMFVIMISKWVGEAIVGPQSIYEAHISLNKYPFLDPKTETHIHARAGRLVRDQQLQVLPERGLTLGDIQNLLEGTEYSGFPVVNDLHSLLVEGYISRRSLDRAVRRALEQYATHVNAETQVVFSSDAETPPGQIVLDMTDYLDAAPMHVDVEAPLHRVLHLFKSLGLRCCLVSRRGKLKGLITRKDLLACLENPTEFQDTQDDEEAHGTGMFEHENTREFPEEFPPLAPEDDTEDGDGDLGLNVGEGDRLVMTSDAMTPMRRQAMNHRRRLAAMHPNRVVRMRDRSRMEPGPQP